MAQIASYAMWLLFAPSLHVAPISFGGIVT